MSASGTLVGVDLLSNWRAAGGSLAGCTVGTIHANLSPQVVAGTQTANPFIEHGIYVDEVGRLGLSPDDPSADPYVDWMVNRTDWIAAATIAEPAWVDGPGSSHWMNRSRRKIEDLQRTLFWIVRPTFNGITSLQVGYQFRILLYLP